MNLLDRAIAVIAPERALARVRARSAIGALMRYDAASQSSRTKSLRAIGTDADAAGAQRERLAHISRDMVRNNPFARRAQDVIASNVVGDGIIPKVIGGTKAQRADMLARIEAHFDGTDIDADGRLNLYGLQRLAIATVVESGEVLIRRRRRLVEDGLQLPFQIEVMEPDFLDASQDKQLSGGGIIRDGIEYDAIGRRVAYHLFYEHPGASGWRIGRTAMSRRVPASEILHIYRKDRPGQHRGVSWLAPIALQLQDLTDYQEAQVMRQKIAACFAAFRTLPDGSDETAASLTSIIPGRIQTLGYGESITFADPPGVTGYDEFTRAVLRSIAAGLGITYEALVGDLSNVNFSSARIGRQEMERNVTAWQWLMVIPQMCQPIGQWALEALQSARGPSSLRLEWVPPARIIVDPGTEIDTAAKMVRNGFRPLSDVVREFGHDPERVLEAIAADNAEIDRLGLTLDTDPRRTSAGGQAQQAPQQTPNQGGTAA